MKQSRLMSGLTTLLAWALWFEFTPFCYPLQASPARATTTAKQEEEVRQAQQWLDEGVELFAKGKIAGAARDFEKVYKLFPNVPDVAFNYGMALETLQDFSRAIEPLEKAVAARPDDTVARLDLGVSYLGVNRFQDGMTELEKVLAADPNNIVAMFQLALAYHQLEKNDKADEWLRTLIERVPDSPLTYVYVARVFCMSHRFQSAKENVEHAIALDPKMAEAYFQLGMIEIGLARSEEGEKALQKALTLSPEMSKYIMAMGEFHLFIRHDAKEALPYFERTIQSDPDSAEAYLDLGDAYLRLRQLPLAEQALQRAIQLEAKERRRCHYLLGVTYKGEGRKAEAEREFATAQKLSGEEEIPPVLH